MGDCIYDEQLSLIPKLNVLSVIKTVSDNDLKGTSDHKNGYINDNNAKGSHSGSQIVVNKLDVPAPFVQGCSQGNGKYRREENSSENIILTDRRKIFSTSKTLTQHSNKQINSVIGNAAGGRQSSPDAVCLKSNEPSETVCNKIKDDVGNHTESLAIRGPVVRDSRNSSYESFHSIKAEENSSSASLSSYGCRPDKKAITTCPEKSSEIQNFIPTEEIKDSGKSLSRLHSRTCSDIDRRTPLSPLVKDLDKNSNAKCSVSVATRIYSTRLADASYLVGTFPEKSVHKKIIQVLAEKGDVHYMDTELKGLLPQNLECLIANEDIAWYRWYISKLEQSRQKREAKKNEEIIKVAEEERQKEHRVQKQEVEDRAICTWRQRKDKETKAKHRELAKKLELERQKKEIEQSRIQIIAQRAHEEWTKRKDIERKGMDNLKHEYDFVKEVLHCLNHSGKFKYRANALCHRHCHRRRRHHHHHHHHHLYLLLTGFLFPGASPLEPVVHPNTQGSKCQIITLLLLRAMFLVQVFYRESIDAF
jgi:hypothetical protein